MLGRLVDFERAGADVLYAPGLPDTASIRRVRGATSRPLNFVVGVSPFRPSLEELRELGVKRVTTGTSFARAALQGLLDAAREVVEEGTFEYTGRLKRVSELNEFFSGGRR